MYFHEKLPINSFPLQFVDAAREPGNYEILLQVTREDGNENLEETKLPKLILNFSIDSPGDEPSKFVAMFITILFFNAAVLFIF